MKRIITCLFLMVVFIFLFVNLSSADEISDLKKQLSEMQKQMQQQARQMQIMQEKIEELESQRVAAPKPAQPQLAAQKESSPLDFRAYWKDGLCFENADKSFSIKIGGRVQTDFGGMKTDSAMKNTPYAKLNENAEFRRARIGTSGTIFEDFVYKLEYDFSTGDAVLDDGYIGLNNIPLLGLVRVGHFTEPFCLEDLTSSKYITFMERSLPYVFSPHRNTGFAFSNTLFDKRSTLAAGVFFDANDQGKAVSSKANFSTRFTGLPWYENDGANLLHLGIGYSFRNPKATLRYHSNPESHLAPDFVDTGSIATDYANVLGLEAAAVWGPFSLQSEFIQSLVDQINGSSDTYFNGVYLEASYFLTGEHRNYDRSVAQFVQVRPFKNFSLKDNAWGAWELAARYSYLDLDDEGVSGGILSDATLGLNWYLNPNIRLMANYIHAHRNGIGDADIGMMRFQVYF